MTEVRATGDQIARLAHYSSCEIADALVKLGHPTGGYVPDLERYSGLADDKLVGEVFTVELVDGRDQDAPRLSGHFVDLAPHDSVVFISSPAHTKSASLGGLLATALSVKGVRGVITFGRCRDLAELRTLAFPVFARGHSSLGQSPFTRPSRVQVPLEIQPQPTASTPFEPSFPPTVVHPHDIVVADLDGVVVVRPEQIEEVLRLAADGQAVDEKCREDIAGGAGVQETFARRRGK